VGKHRGEVGKEVDMVKYLALLAVYFSEVMRNNAHNIFKLVKLNSMVKASIN